MEIAVIGHNADLEYESVSVPALLEGCHDNHLVHLTGMVRDAFIDEVDPTCVFWSFKMVGMRYIHALLLRHRQSQGSKVLLERRFPSRGFVRLISQVLDIILEDASFSPDLMRFP
jgi:hypothetical protein